MTERDKVFSVLNDLGIVYEVTTHPAVYTIEEIDTLGLDKHGGICKNLFLRDAAGHRHFLVVLRKDKKADLKALQAQLGTSRLGFASEERLHKYLKLTKGEVTPLGVLNDDARAVEIVFDRDLSGQACLGVHPNDNTATVWLSFESLLKVVTEHGSVFRFADFPD